MDLSSLNLNLFFSHNSTASLIGKYSVLAKFQDEHTCKILDCVYLLMKIYDVDDINNNMFFEGRL